MPFTVNNCQLSGVVLFLLKEKQRPTKIIYDSISIMTGRACHGAVVIGPLAVYMHLQGTPTNQLFFLMKAYQLLSMLKAARHFNRALFSSRSYALKFTPTCERSTRHTRVFRFRCPGQGPKQAKFRADFLLPDPQARSHDRNEDTGSWSAQRHT